MDSAAGWDAAGAAVELPLLQAPMAKAATSPSAARRVREFMLTWVVPPKVPALGAGGIRGSALPLVQHPDRRSRASTVLCYSVKRLLTPGRIEPVADAANGDQMRRLFGLGLDLRAQPADMDVDRPRVTVVTVAPRSVKELAPRPGATRVAGQDGEQIEFLGPQVDEPAVPPQLVREEIELAASSDREAPAGAGPRPLVEQGEAGRELAGFDRARHCLIEAESQGLETDLYGIGRRNLDDP